MKTLLLDQTNWDLCLDSNGNIALAAEPYAIAQDVASAVRLFLAELWYDSSKGVPYFEQILGRRVPSQVIQAQIEKAARTVPLVTGAVCILASLKNRVLSGQIIVSSPGSRLTLSFTGSNAGLITFVGN